MRPYIFIMLLISPLVFGCESFLSEVPDDRTELKDVESIKALLVSGLPGRTLYVAGRVDE